MLLSVVVVNWNSRSHLGACLAALERQTHRELEVIVVDNGSSDGSVELVKREHPGVRLVAQGDNLGFAEGCNRGIALAQGEWVALLNNDTVADERWAEALCRAAAELPADCGMLQSLMLFFDEPDTVNSTGIVLARTGGGEDRGERRPRPPPGGSREEIFCPSGGAAAYRKSMLAAIALPSGYLDREFFCYFEDMDLGWRARLAGFRAFFVPDSIVLHHYHGSTSRRGDEWLVTMTHVNRLRMLLKNASLPFLLRTLPTSAKQVVRLFTRGEPGSARSLARGLYAGLAERRRVAALAQRPRRGVELEWAGRRPA
jgi:GT2 family glycosyltransferase